MRPHPRLTLLLALLVASVRAQTPAASVPAAPWIPDRGDGTYKNPVLFADYSDPDAIRVGDDFYLVSSSFACAPSLPILRSKDLVNWTIVNHAVAVQPPADHFSAPRHGEGVWAPAIRYHAGKFWISYPDPDYGIYVITARRAEGEWTAPRLIKAGRGLIDPCLFWDDDGQLYLIHGWAKSRAGIANLLTLNKLSADGSRVTDAGIVVIDGNKIPGWTTLEGPKLYKRHGYYYVFAPSGGVGHGYQAVFRAKDIRGPYEHRVVLDQGDTPINGPHQGAWVDTPTGEDWFLHFQDLGPYGRVVHLEPMTWRADDWPVIGAAAPGAEKGEPVLEHAKPNVGRTYPVAAPQTSDEFDGRTLGLQWQWSANPRPGWASFTARPGFLRLTSVPAPRRRNNGQPAKNSLYDAPNFLLQKFPAPEFVATAALELGPGAEGERAGLAVFGFDYAWLGLRRSAGGLRLVYVINQGANNGAEEREVASTGVASGRIFLRVRVSTDAVCRFSYSFDNRDFIALDEPFKASVDRWIGAKLGVFAVSDPAAAKAGYADFDWFRVAPPDRAGAVDLRPDGPAVGTVQAAAAGATVVAHPEQVTFRLNFPAGSGKPGAVFSFPETDISDRLGVALDIGNAGTDPVRIYADLNEDTWVRGYVTVPPGQSSTLYVFARRKKLSPEESALFPNMHGIPGGKMSLWAGIEEPIIAARLKVFMVSPQTDAQIQVGNIRPFGSSKIPDLAGFYPFIDRYGQYAHRDWPGKVSADADLAANRLREDADLAAHPSPADRDGYGGWLGGPQLRASGHFRTEKFQGKWWLVDPDGRLFWSDGLDCVGFNQSFTTIAGRERFYADPAPGGDFLGRNLGLKYGADWRNVAGDRLLARLRSWGLNTMGGGADRTIAQKRKVPYTLQISTGGRSSPINPDSPAWAENARARIAAAAATAKDDPWCIGVFVDNEIHASTDPAWFERYYRQVSAWCKQSMPDTLYLGSRLDYHDWPDVPENYPKIVRVAAQYCDVISFNFYKFTLDDFALPAGVDRPAIIGEFHLGALDRGLFHTGLRSVLDQDQRAEGYRLYVTSALRNGALVGAHWFQCYDESTTGRFDGEDYQIGFLDIGDSPYVETVAAAREVGDRLYSIRSAEK